MNPLLATKFLAIPILHWLIGTAVVGTTAAVVYKATKKPSPPPFAPNAPIPQSLLSKIKFVPLPQQPSMTPEQAVAQAKNTAQKVVNFFDDFMSHGTFLTPIQVAEKATWLALHSGLSQAEKDAYTPATYAAWSAREDGKTATVKDFLEKATKVAVKVAA